MLVDVCVLVEWRILLVVAGFVLDTRGRWWSVVDVVDVGGSHLFMEALIRDSFHSLERSITSSQTSLFSTVTPTFPCCIFLHAKSRCDEAPHHRDSVLHRSVNGVAIPLGTYIHKSIIRQHSVGRSVTYYE
jgi:hypothetical protein